MNSQQHKAILDIGTNSFHFVVYKVRDDKSFLTIYRKRIVYRLALQKQNEKSFLSDEDFAQTLIIIEELKKIASQYSCIITATATSAIREASNKDAYLEHVQKTTGVSIELLSGEKEALLIYKAVAHYNKDAFSKRILCLDIGGGSTECILGEKGKILFVESLVLGAVRLSMQFFPGDKLDRNKIEVCRSFIHKAIEPIKQRVVAANMDFVTGNSGTIYAMKILALANRSNLGLEPQEEKILTREELEKAVDLLLSHKTIKERKTIPGIEPDRAAILPAGALILQSFFSMLNLSSLYLSDYSMREGKLLEILENVESEN